MPKKKTIYQDLTEWGELKDVVEVSADFLPKPEELLFKTKSKKVTLVLDEESVDFFKHEAIKLNTSYQRMIRTLLNKYARQMSRQ